MPYELRVAFPMLNSSPPMTKNQTTNIGKLLVEIALAITPIVLEEGRRWLARRSRAGNVAPRSGNPKPKAA